MADISTQVAGIDLASGIEQRKQYLGSIYGGNKGTKYPSFCNVGDWRSHYLRQHHRLISVDHSKSTSHSAAWFNPLIAVPQGVPAALVRSHARLSVPSRLRAVFLGGRHTRPQQSLSGVDFIGVESRRAQALAEVDADAEAEIEVEAEANTYIKAGTGTEGDAGMRQKETGCVSRPSYDSTLTQKQRNVKKQIGSLPHSRRTTKQAVGNSRNRDVQPVHDLLAKVRKLHKTQQVKKNGEGFLPIVRINGLAYVSTVELPAAARTHRLTERVSYAELTPLRRVILKRHITPQILRTCLQGYSAEKHKRGEPLQKTLRTLRTQAPAKPKRGLERYIAFLRELADTCEAKSQRSLVDSGAVYKKNRIQAEGTSPAPRAVHRRKERIKATTRNNQMTQTEGLSDADHLWEEISFKGDSQLRGSMDCAGLRSNKQQNETSAALRIPKVNAGTKDKLRHTIQIAVPATLSPWDKSEAEDSSVLSCNDST